MTLPALAFTTRILRSRWWRAGATHLLALFIGVALAIAFVPRPTPPMSKWLAVPTAAPTSEFHRALQAIMVQMNAAMCATPSADVDRDFALAMIPHHQGAIEMAKLELLYGSDARLRRLAEGIVVDQSQEIALIHNILANSSTVYGANLNP
jgi:Domain of unknown function (DUF305)